LVASVLAAVVVVAVLRSLVVVGFRTLTLALAVF
jgi:hypothetical protein